MNIDFPLILVILTFLSGLIALIDLLFFAKPRKKTQRKIPIIFEYSRSFFPVFLFVLVIRSFVIQPFRVPTGSLEPTVLPGDFLLVNQFIYGLRLPVLNTKILNISEPKRGDIVVFRFPAKPSVNYVKRVIGLPGDHIIYKNKKLTINGKIVPQKFIKNGFDFEPPHEYIPVKIEQENLEEKKYHIQIRPKNGEDANYDFVVPDDAYFMMGDNRDNSGDSRYWGFVPEKDLVGKAFMIWMSWGGFQDWIRWHRIGNRL
ncbi:MAG: signal peptidase I [Gammaproteobacteria bacterium]|nr:signal peptidase I [Gammaproteobacteria bacterium]